MVRRGEERREEERQASTQNEHLQRWMCEFCVWCVCVCVRERERARERVREIERERWGIVSVCACICEKYMNEAECVMHITGKWSVCVCA